MATATFTGDGLRITFQLSTFPAAVSSVTVAAADTPFKWNGKDITLDDAPADGVEVLVTYTSKLEMVRAMCGQDAENAPDSLLETYILTAGNAILNRRYPLLADRNNLPVPDQYAVLQCEIANETFQKRGAEGETTHNENGVNRSYETAGVSSSLLKRVVPCAKVPGVAYADA